MVAKLVYCYGTFLIFLDTVVKSYLSTNSHTYYSSSEDVRYLVESIPASIHKDLTGASEIKYQNILDDSLYSSKNNLRFQPNVLDFKARHLGVPHNERVLIINTSCNKTMYMSSISGNTIHFHSSFFHDKVIPPLGNTTFNVVFLGREEGKIESFLFIHTSEGTFKYIVRGESIGSPYRIRQFSGIKIPLNATYAPLIYMHNPHSTPLQLIEVYSSGGEFHLELPSGELEGPKHIWNIPAYITKPIIRLKFHGSSQRNHTAYLRLKIDKSGETLVIPVEVEVGSVCGLYSTDDLIDFGIGGSEHPPKEVNIYLKNSWKKPIRVQNVIAMPVSKALKINFQPVKVPPDNQSTLVAVLKFDWKIAHETGQTAGKIIIKSGHTGQKLILTYMAKVLSGGLLVGQSEARFMPENGSNQTHTVNLTNKFNIPVAITNATLDSTAKEYFKINNFVSTIIMPGKSKSVLFIGLKKETLPAQLRLQTSLLMHTNVSVISIPILCYDGRLNKLIPSETNDTELYLGTVGSGNTKIVYFALINENPVTIQIQNIAVNITKANIRLVALKKGIVTLETLTRVSETFNSSIEQPYVGPGYFCIVELSVQAGNSPGHIQGMVSIFTDHEIISIPVFMRVEHGSLTIITDPVQFIDCFPSAICIAEVRVESKFGLGMAVTGVTSIPYQPRLGFVPTSPPLIPPFSNTLLGHLTWDMSGVESYLSSSSNSTGGDNWLSTLALGSECLELDIGLLRSRYSRYEAWSSVPTSVSLRLDTTEVRGLSFTATVSPGWPSLSPQTYLNLPLTRVGDVSVANLTLINPAASQPVMVQLVLGQNYPSPALLLHVLPSSLRPSSNRSYESMSDDSEDVFQISVDGDSIVPPGINPHKKSITFKLMPLSNVSLKILFKPVRAHLTSSILIIRNNLTILEVVELIGSGAYVQFKFGNRKPGSPTPLLFELVDKQLKECETSEERGHNLMPNLTVQRSFTARNTGVLPITVTSFTINGQPCQGYGFRILNCQPFHLPPNSSKKIDIAFTPDFTLSRVTRLLTILALDMSANYTLMATLPPSLLGACAEIIGRPVWEPFIYYCAVTFMISLFLCVLTASILESNRILRDTIIALSREHNVQPVLDLRAVGSEINDKTEVQERRSSESHSKVVQWDSSPERDNEVSKENQKTLENNSLLQCNNKFQMNQSLLGKKKSERTICVKNLGDINECSNEKIIWDRNCARTSGNHCSKSAKSGICITTEPYTPLANIKTSREAGQNKTDTVMKTKNDQTQRFLDMTSKKQKKKNTSCPNEEGKKKPIETVLTTTNDFEEVESSSASSDSSSNDGGDKEVDSMFFRTVRHHLETKTSTNNLRPGVLRPFKNVKTGSEISPKCLRKSSGVGLTPPEKNRNFSADNDWEIEEDDSVTKATLVKNSRRLNASAKPSKKLTSTSITSRVKTDQVQTKAKTSVLTERVKTMAKKDKGQVSKKRTEKYNKHVPLSKGLSCDGIPPPPPAPIWTTSFSDVVQRSDTSYSSVVSLRSNSLGHQLSNNVNQQANTNLGTIGAKPQINMTAAWNSWATVADNIQCPPTLQHTVGNSLFTTDTASCVPTNCYDNSLWSELIDLQVPEELQINPHPDVNQPYNNPNEERTWPVMPSLWEPLYTPPTVENAPPVWGSDVWGPPAPPVPQEDLSHHTTEFDPFRSLSNIWTQHNASIWKPPSSTN